MAKKKVAPSRLARERKAQVRGLLAFSLTVFLIKIMWLSSKEGRGLLGADGENYLEALSGLLSEGFFSEQGKLSYWPAGYPILMWPIAAISESNLAFIVGIIQSLIFALSRLAGLRQRHFLRMRDAICSVGDVAHSNRRPLDCGLFRTIIQRDRLFGRECIFECLWGVWSQC